MSRAPELRGRKAQRHESTRWDILQAAWSLSGERGVAGWSLREVATAVGMRAPSLYVYFDSKDAIYDAMFAQGYTELLTRVDATSLDGEPAAVVRRAAQVFFDFCVEDPARHQLLFLRPIPRFAPSAQSYRLAETALERLASVLTAAGAGAPEAIDLWTAVLTGLATQQISNDPGGHRWARLIDLAVDAFIGATRTGGDASGRGCP